MANICLATGTLSDNLGIITTTLGASAPVVGMPLTNLKTMQPVDKWRTTGVSKVSIDIDMGATMVAVGGYNVIALLATNASYDATWQITTATSQSNLTSSPIYDSGVINFKASAETFNGQTVNNSPINGIQYLGTSNITDKWIRIEIFDTSNADGYFEAGRLYVSQAWFPTYNIPYGWSINWVDPSLLSYSAGSNTFVTLRSKYRELSFDLKWISENEMYNNGYMLDKLFGKSKDVLIVKDIENTTRRHDQMIYGLFTELTPIINQTFNIYNKRYKIKELL